MLVTFVTATLCLRKTAAYHDGTVCGLLQFRSADLLPVVIRRNRNTYFPLLYETMGYRVRCVSSVLVQRHQSLRLHRNLLFHGCEIHYIPASNKFNDLTATRQGQLLRKA